MPFPLICAKLYFQPSIAPAEGLVAIRNAVASVGSYMGSELKPEFEDTHELLKNQDVKAFEESGYYLSFLHEPMSRLVEATGWYVTFAYDEFGADQSQIRITLDVGHSESGFRSVWEFVVATMPRFVAVMRPSLAMVNAIPEIEDIEYLPSRENIHPGELPPYFTPWVYLAGDRLTSKRRQRLKRLSAYISEPLDHGWLVMPTRDFFQRPSDDCLAEIASLSNTVAVSYKQTAITQEDIE